MTMSKKSLVALKGSIEAWENKLKFAEQDELFRMGTTSCPLCLIYHEAHRVERTLESKHCYRCPIKLHTGKTNCKNTPYDNVYMIRKIETDMDQDKITYRHSDTKERLLKAIKEEITFLKSLLP